MDKAKMLEIAAMAQEAAVDAVKQQIKNGAPDRGMPKARHVAVVAYVVNEIVDSYQEGDRKEVLRAALSGSLLNASQFRQELEKAGVLQVDSPVANQYSL